MIMNKLEISSGFLSDEEYNINITIEGSQDNNKLIVGAIKSLLSSLDIKDVYDGDYERLQGDFEELLYALVDVMGYQHYYWNLPDSDTSYNEFDELIVSNNVKLAYLKELINQMEHRVE